ncbi:MAG: (S)-ureidoglycine aminohydrolase [Planctomycetota bacterium]|nr:(S)-ureidoglycine aminohydrolase [Planctomycetota bacterium]
MRSPHQLVHSRARVAQRYALFPLEGYPTSRMPSWPDADVRVLAAPALGSRFVQYLIDLPDDGSAGEFAAAEGIETFFHVMTGAGVIGGKDKLDVSTGDFGLIPTGQTFAVTARQRTRLLILRKRYEPVTGMKPFKGCFGNVSDVEAEAWAGNAHARLQTLIPDELQYDMAMNIFTFDPGHGLPYVETHVMEHGLLMLEGKGMYYLDGEWMEVEKDDFIWMGPYCPQSFYATGPTPAKYIYYKNVNREISL